MAEDANGRAAGSADAPVNQADIGASLAVAEGSGAAEADPAPADSGSAKPPSEPAQGARVDSTGRPFDEAAAAMAPAIEEEKAVGDSVAQAAPGGQPLDLPDFTGDGDSDALNQDIDLLHDVNLRVKIELGRTRMFVEDVLKLTEGSVVELDKLAGDPVDVFANDQLIARGEVLILNDNFCVRVSEIVSGGAASALNA